MEIHEYIRRHHKHELNENQCTSALVKHIIAPVDLVWSLVRRFDQPQGYKPFVSKCTMQGELNIGSLRQVNVKSGLPATTSTERLELLDDEEHILGIRIVGGDHRLRNYSSIITVHPEIVDGRPGTLVIESFVVDVPDGNTKDETCYFVRALINCNLKSLAEVSERLAAIHEESGIVTRVRVCE
ncbi:hypothetical protein RHMOL_Rhmol07G0007500 [Rhododendron molle]|uniref:Uncharacterized protein n=1 Tax=Rhododendron molle TaxID=49168 RepID=A0ACC0MVN4_RHOML|nr:hypothetical protein RHMOL_Rhmol07G0007500 [Rhododendron molle]